MKRGCSINSAAIFSMRGGIVAENMRFCLLRGRLSSTLRTLGKLALHHHFHRLAIQSNRHYIHCLPAAQTPCAEGSLPRPIRRPQHKRDLYLSLKNIQESKQFALIVQLQVFATKQYSFFFLPWFSKMSFSLAGVAITTFRSGTEMSMFYHQTSVQ